jgi:pimeloyl-ACP methyl ester carboxylesterase
MVGVNGPIATTVACGDGTVLPLHRFDGGDGARAVVLCHGFIQNASAWSVPRHSFIDFLVDAGVTVYTIELRGRSHRSHAPHDLLATVEHDAATVVAAVRARGHRQVAWVGHSMGGLIGCALGGLDPATDDAALPDHHLDAVVAIGSPLLPGRSFLHHRVVIGGIVGFGRAMGRLGLPFEGARYAKGFVRARRILDTPLAYATPLPLWKPGAFADDRDLLHTLSSSFASDSHDVLADLVDLVDTVGQRAGRLSMNDHLARLRAPLLAIAGTFDALAPPDSVHALYARARSPLKRFLEVDAGHIDLVVGDRAPALVWRPIVRFLDEVFDTTAALR